MNALDSLTFKVANGLLSVHELVHYADLIQQLLQWHAHTIRPG